MLSKKIASYVSLFLVTVLALVMLFSTMALEATAVEVTGVSGVEVTVDSNGSISESGGTVTVTAKGSFTSAKTATITVKNTSGSTANISFDYSGKNVGDCSFGGVSSNKCSGSKTFLLTAGASTTFTITSRSWTTSLTVTMTLSNFKVEAVAAESNVTVTYGSLGSVKLDGTAIASGSVNKVSSSTGGSFVAVPGSGSKFVAWINPSTNAVLSTSATYQLVPTENMTIRAVFAKSSAEPVFFADGTSKVFESWDAALSYVSSASNKVITLASDGTLAAGNYIIPSGITVNIPYDSAATLRTTAPTEHENTYTKPSVFRTLNMAAGANLTVNGSLSLSAAVSSKIRYNGMPSGPLSFIKMANGSKITIENGGNLYAWGFITGSGSVEVKNGGTVYEAFQVGDYRGGDVTTKMNNNSNTYGVFPFTQYYLQNVEVPMTLHAGAKENGYFLVYVSIAGNQHSEVPFIGSDNSMFRINTGYVVKDYIEGTGRTDISIFGDISVSSISLSLKVSLLGNVKIDSSKYVMPIPNHFTVNVESGVISMDQSLALLPGSELFIKEGVTCTLGSGKKIIVYDWDEWQRNDGANGYAGYNELYSQLKYVPGGDGTTGRKKDALVQVDGTIDASAGAIYVTTGGANICSTGTGVIKLTLGTETTTTQIITNGSDISSWPTIAIKPAFLKNGNDSYVQSITNTYTYCSECLTWVEGAIHTKGGNYIATNVALGNSLEMFFAFVADGAGDGWNVTITCGTTTKNIPYDDWEYNITLNAYYVVFEGLTAKQMKDTVSVELNDGTKVVSSWNDSIYCYSQRIRDKNPDNTELEALIVDMLNYGAACQTLLGYKTHDLANAGITGESSDYDFTGVSTDTPVSDIFDSSNLITTGNIQFAVLPKDGVTATNATFVFRNHWNTKDVSGNLQQGQDESGTVYYYVDMLVVADAKQMITITYNSETYVDSIEQYCARVYANSGATDEQRAAVLAFMKFSESARIYLETEGAKVP